MNLLKSLFTAVMLLATTLCFGQSNKEPNLHAVGRNLSVHQENGVTTIRLDEQNDDGKAWLVGRKFTNGTIEFDIKGKDTLQHSFVGFAFHGVNDSTYDCIYFRPFNFRATDPVRHSHAVQYVSPPKYDWEILRNQFPNKYEQPLPVPPDPNGWFHAKIVVNGKHISVFVNNDPKPVLEVEQIVPLKGEMLGYWVGNTSGGWWKNLKITNK
ncbi:MAG TPA: hypothetical protein VIM55_00670 [Mucilaginibacter sp.]